MTPESVPELYRAERSGLVHDAFVAYLANRTVGSGAGSGPEREAVRAVVAGVLASLPDRCRLAPQPMPPSPAPEG